MTVMKTCCGKCFASQHLLIDWLICLLKIYFLDDELTAFCKESEWQISGEFVSIGNQEENVKSKNISEKITFDSKLPLFWFGFYLSDAILRICIETTAFKIVWLNLITNKVKFM